MRLCHLTFLLGCVLAAQSPESIRPAGSLRLAGLIHDPKALKGAHDVELQGNLAFVPGKGGNLAIVDIADPAKPRLLSAFTGGKEFEDAETVLPYGDVLFVGTRDFLAIDIKDPAHPKVLKVISERPRIDRINGMALWGHYVYAVNKSGFVDAFDISNPRAPVLHDVLDTKANGGLGSPHAIETLKDHIIVANTGRSEKVNVLTYRITDATGKLLPASQWKSEGAAPSSRDIEWDWLLTGANRLVVWDGYAAVGAYVPDRVAIFEMPKPGALTQIANMPTCDIDATGMTVSGQMLFVAGGECVEAIDVSNPARPVSVAQYRGGAVFPTRLPDTGPGKSQYGNGHDVVYRDGYIYVTAQNDHRLGIVKVMDPEIVKKAKPAATADWKRR